MHLTPLQLTSSPSALTVAKAFISSKSSFSNPLNPSPFIYISAEDIFRPIVPSRYIETKREAELGILQLAAQSESSSRGHEEETSRLKSEEEEEVVLADADGAGLEREIETERAESSLNSQSDGSRRIRPVFIRPGE